MWRKDRCGGGGAKRVEEYRKGRNRREDAVQIGAKTDGPCPEIDAGVPIADGLDRIGSTRTRMNEILDEFANWEIMRRVVDNAAATPILIGPCRSPPG